MNHTNRIQQVTFPFLLICVSHSLAYYLIKPRSVAMIRKSVLFLWAIYSLCSRLLAVIFFALLLFLKLATLAIWCKQVQREVTVCF